MFHFKGVIFSFRICVPRSSNLFISLVRRCKGGWMNRTIFKVRQNQMRLPFHLWLVNTKLPKTNNWKGKFQSSNFFGSFKLIFFWGYQTHCHGTFLECHRMAPLLFPPAGCVRTHFFQAIAQTHHTSTELDHCQKHKHQASLHDIFMKASNQIHEIGLPFIFMIIIIHQEKKAAAVNFHQLSPLKYLPPKAPNKNHLRASFCASSLIFWCTSSINELNSSMFIPTSEDFHFRPKITGVSWTRGTSVNSLYQLQGILLSQSDDWFLFSPARKVLGSTSPIMAKMKIRYIYNI